MARSQKDMPSRSAIVRAWIDYQTEHGSIPWGSNLIDWGEPQCWACAYWSRSWPDGSIKAWDKAAGLERCHVIPHSLGGSDQPLNLVLMCGDCHRASPDHVDPEYLYDWMLNQPKRIDGVWLPDQVAEMRRLAEVAVERMTEAEMLSITHEAIQDFMDGAGVHFGSITDGTRAAAVAHIRKRLEAS